MKSFHYVIKSLLLYVIIGFLNFLLYLVFLNLSELPQAGVAMMPLLNLYFSVLSLAVCCPILIYFHEYWPLPFSFTVQLYHFVYLTIYMLVLVFPRHSIHQYVLMAYLVMLFTSLMIWLMVYLLLKLLDQKKRFH